MVEGGGSPGESAPGFPQRVILIYTDPERAMRAVDLRPQAWWQPLILLAILGVISISLTWDRVILPEQIEAIERRAGGADLEQAMSMVESGWMRGVAYASGALMPAVLAVLVALASHLAAAFLLGGGASFVRTLAVVSHALLIGIVEVVAKVSMMLIESTSKVYFGPALLLSPGDPPGFLFSLLSHVDLFTLWELWLVAVGLAIVHRVKRSSILWALLGLWALWSVGSSAVTASFGGG
jgi:hypothetical protein